jgi:thiol-disulfide isomerase/thioredoxin
MKYRMLLALFAAALLAGCSQRSDQQLLTELNKLTDPPDEKQGKFDEAAKRKRAENAQSLLREFEERHPNSPQLNEARAKALEVLRLPKEPAEGAADVARKLRDEAPKGSDLAAQGDLFLALQEWKEMFRGAPDIKDAWNQNAEGIRTRLETLLTTYPKNTHVANVAAELFRLADAADDLKTRRLILELIPKNLPSHPLARIAEREQAVGREFTFAFTPVGSDKQLSVKDLRGKVVVLDFWATWCGPCVAEMPRLKALYERYREKGLEVIGVSLDDEEGKLTRFVKARDIRWPQAFGPDARTLRDQWGVESIPTVFVLDREGRLHSLNARGKLEKMVPELLGEK